MRIACRMTRMAGPDCAIIGNLNKYTHTYTHTYIHTYINTILHMRLDRLYHAAQVLAPQSSRAPCLILYLVAGKNCDFSTVQVLKGQRPVST